MVEWEDSLIMWCDCKCIIIVMVDYDVIGDEILVKFFVCVCKDIEVIKFFNGYEL